LQHWYGYHSEKTMGYPYAKVGSSAMYLRRPQTRLEIGDVVWVVEGVLGRPTRFGLVDCFRYSDAEHPPFAPGYSRFTVRILGHRSLLKASSPLNLADKWFFELHSRFITKQKFFNSLAAEPEIVDGLCSISGVKF